MKSLVLLSRVEIPYIKPIIITHPDSFEYPFKMVIIYNVTVHIFMFHLHNGVTYIDFLYNLLKILYHIFFFNSLRFYGIPVLYLCIDFKMHEMTKVCQELLLT